MKRRLLILGLALAPLWAIAQNLISGHIKDVRTGEPLIGASVIVKSEKGQGVVTNVDGNFKLQTKKEAPLTLRVEYIGYRPLDVEVYDFEEPVEIAIADNSNKLEELVVLGYQTLKRKNLTGAVASVEGGDLESIAGASFTEKLQGQAPGMLVSNSSGTPGTSVFVRLRGTTSINAGNDPLYIVDGIPFNGNSIQSLDQGALVANPLADISPDDIKDVQVLKDASATAIYGARAANGVILITTKRGQKNKKTQVNVKAEIGWGKAAKLWDVLDGPNTAILLNEIAVNDGKKTTYDPNTADNYILRDKAFRTAKQQSIGSSITGGNDRTNFFIGIDYTDQEAILETQGFRRIGLRANLDHDINKKLTFSSSNQLTFTRRTLSPTGDGPTSLLQTSVQHNPLVNPYKDDGSYNYSGTFENIYAILNNNDNKSYGLRNLNNLTLTWKVTPELRFKSSWSYDNNQFRERRYYNSQLKNGSPNGNAREVSTNVYTLTAEQLLNYNKTFKKIHEIAAFIGNSVQYAGKHTTSVSGSDFPSDAFSEIGSAAVTEGSTSGSSNSLISWFGGFNYVSREVELNPDNPFDYYNLTSKNGDKNFGAFLKDLQSLNSKWVIFVLAKKEPDLSCHFLYGAKRGDTSYDDPDIWVKDVETFDATSHALEDVWKQHEVRSTWSAFKRSKNYIGREIGDTNSFTIRVSYNILLRYPKKMSLALATAKELKARLDPEHPFTADPKWKEHGYGYHGLQNACNENSLL